MVEKWAPQGGTPDESTAPPEHEASPAEDDRLQSNAPLDVEKALNQLGGDRELFNELLAIFLSDLPRLTGAIESAASQADAAGLHAAAHSLKGAASNICAEPTRCVAQQLEKMGQQGELVHVDALLGELHDHLERLREFAAPLYAT